MRRLPTTVLVLALGLLAHPLRAAARPIEIAVVTHPSHPVALTRADVRRMFLKQRRFWSDGGTIIAVNQTAASRIRVSFERAVFASEAAGLPAYWNRRYFEGVFPPIALDSDEAVLRYVAATRDAIGYVDARVVDATVHVAYRTSVPPR